MKKEVTFSVCIKDMQEVKELINESCEQLKKADARITELEKSLTELLKFSEDPTNCTPEHWWKWNEAKTHAEALLLK